MGACSGGCQTMCPPGLHLALVPNTRERSCVQHPMRCSPSFTGTALPPGPQRLSHTITQSNLEAWPCQGQHRAWLTRGMWNTPFLVSVFNIILWLIWAFMLRHFCRAALEGPASTRTSWPPSVLCLIVLPRATAGRPFGWVVGLCRGADGQGGRTSVPPGIPSVK